MTDTLERTDTALAEIFDSLMREVHTCMPGRVTAFDRDTQTCSVQPCLKRKFKNREPEEITPCENVPVIFPGSGDRWVVFDIDVDSYVLLVFSERAIANWMDKGGTVDPKQRRIFSMSDAIAIPCILPTPVKLSGGITADTIMMRNEDASYYISLNTSTGQADINGNFTVDP